MRHGTTRRMSGDEFDEHSTVVHSVFDPSPIDAGFSVEVTNGVDRGRTLLLTGLTPSRRRPQRSSTARTDRHSASRWLSRCHGGSAPKWRAFLRERATGRELHMAVVAAAIRGRYHLMIKAMEAAKVEPVVIEDLVEIGRDLGLEQGRAEGIEKGRAEGVDAVRS